MAIRAAAAGLIAVSTSTMGSPGTRVRPAARSTP